MNAVRSQELVAADLGMTRQGVAVAECRALEKTHLMLVLGRDFPRLPGETFAEWFGQLRACAKFLATSSGRARTQPTQHHARIQTDRNPGPRRR